MLADRGQRRAEIDCRGGLADAPFWLAMARTRGGRGLSAARASARAPGTEKPAGRPVADRACRSLAAVHVLIGFP